MDSGKMWCFLPIISEKGERYNAKMKGKMGKREKTEDN
jgi:hypothetical protein